MMPKFRHDWWQGVRQSGEINRDVMVKNLLDVRQTLNHFNIPFFLAGGTLLGLIRQNDFISWDHDIDLFCLNEDTRHDACKMRWVKNELENKEFYIVDSSRCRCKCEYFIRSGERVDLFWLDLIDDEWVFNNTMRFPRKFFDHPETRTFFNKLFLVPNNPEGCLEYCYGEDWKTPKEGTGILNLNPKVRKWKSD